MSLWLAKKTAEWAAKACSEGKWASEATCT